MAFQVSPGVDVNEVDLTNIIPAVSTTNAGFAGFFNWGPVDQRITVSSTNNLKEIFGDPDDNNKDHWFSAANFLNYGANLQVVRVVDSDAKNAGNSGGLLIKNRDDYNGKTDFSGNNFIAKFPGGEQDTLGNSILVSIGNKTSFGITIAGTGPANGDTSVHFGAATGFGGGGSTTDIVAGTTFADNLVIAGVRRPITSMTSDASGVTVTFTSPITNREAGKTAASIEWKYANNFNTKLPATSDFAARVTGLNDGVNDLVHVAVVDKNGDWTGTVGGILETFSDLSVAPNAKDEQGKNIFYKDRLNDSSQYVYVGEHLAGASLGSGTGAQWGTALTPGLTYAQSIKNQYLGLTGGGATFPAAGDFFTDGFEKFEDPETVDVSILVGGPSTNATAKSIRTMVENRKDCIAFFSPPEATVLTNSGTPKKGFVAAANVVAYRNGTDGALEGGDFDGTSNNLNVSSSYCVLDSGWKYMFDRFADKFRYVPLNADIAGIAVRADFESEPWFSPAGLNRGQVQGVIQLAFDPTKTERDTLYLNGVNPVASFPGQGTVLFGDKTLLAKPSAFDRINVRRLFIVLEKAIAAAAKFSLFELNDNFTRAQFKNLIEPFLLDVQARRGITNFKVVCDDTNNTSEVIDRNEFVADIFVQPTRSINFITLNFVATRTGVNFDEIAGV